jgi:exopolysaccharide biosynthesis polyprenyl glycosylphosphotransferase
MLKNYQRFIGGVLYVLELLCTYLALFIAWFIRFHAGVFLQYFPLEHGYRPLSYFLNPRSAVVIAIIWLLVFQFNGMHKPRRWRQSYNLWLSIFSSVTMAVTILVVFAFFYRNQSFSRLVVGLFWILDVLLIYLSRWAFGKLLIYLRGRGFNRRYALVIGAGELGRTFVEKLQEQVGLGVEIKGILDDDPGKLGMRIGQARVLGNLEKIHEILEKEQIHEVYIALPLSAHRRMFRLLSSIKNECLDIKVIPDLMQYITLRAAVEELDGIPIVNLSHTPLNGWMALIKRALDILLAGIGLIILSPLFLAVAIAIKLTSPGPVFYKQVRMGLDLKPFKMLKFRSMVVDAESRTGPVFASADDPRRTRVGAFIRKYGIDELPQLINVLKGEMSLVGPRPERPPFVEEFRTKFPRYALRHKVKSGLTGWAQVNGLRGDTSIRKRLEFDIYYIENWSLAFDFKILLLTLARLTRNAV